MIKLTEEQVKNSKGKVIKNSIKILIINKDLERNRKNYGGMKKTTLKSIDDLVPEQKVMFTVFLNRVFKHYFGIKYTP